jgi:hypothetical protein
MTNEARFYAQTILSMLQLVLFVQTRNQGFMVLTLIWGAVAVYNAIIAAGKAWKEATS